jgi:hypothetical protein
MGGGNVARAIDDLFAKRIGETKRVHRADAFGRSAYRAAGLEAEYNSAICDTLHCVKIRNQYAHCIWHDDNSERLAFAHMEDITAPNGPDADPANLIFSHVDVELLAHQEAFFLFVKDTLNFLNYRRRQLTGTISNAANLRVPTTVQRPLLHL